MSAANSPITSPGQEPKPLSQMPRIKESLAMSAANSPITSPGQEPKPLSQMQEGPTLLGPSNTKTTCPFCSASIKTATRYTTTTRTHITAILCCFIMCCCCLPYCMNSTRNTDHYCPNCQKFLGTYNK